MRNVCNLLKATAHTHGDEMYSISAPIIITGLRASSKLWKLHERWPIFIFNKINTKAVCRRLGIQAKRISRDSWIGAPESIQRAERCVDPVYALSMGRARWERCSCKVREKRRPSIRLVVYGIRLIFIFIFSLTDGVWLFAFRSLARSPSLLLYTRIQYICSGGPIMSSESPRTMVTD
jgi:hypothetical protein